MPVWFTKNHKSTSFIFQAFSMAVQRGNVQFVQGAYSESALDKLDDIFYTVQTNDISLKTHFDMSKILTWIKIIVYWGWKSTFSRNGLSSCHLDQDKSSVIANL